MKHFYSDWADFARCAAIWSKLRPGVRQLYLMIKRDAGVSAAGFGDDLQLLLEEKLVTTPGNGAMARLHDQAQSFSRALRAMSRQPLFPAPSHDALTSYLREHFSPQELSALGRGAGVLHASEGMIAERVTSENWLLGLLSADAAAWERGRISWGVAPLAKSTETIDAVKALVRAAMTWREPVPLAELPSLAPSMSPDIFNQAVEFCVRYLLLFVGALSDLTPVIGLWPRVTARLHRPKPAPPPEATPRHVFGFAYRLEDMTTFLVAAAQGRLRLRVDSRELFERTHDALLMELVALPSWAETWIGESREMRLIKARQMLESMRLIQEGGSRGEGLRWEPAGGANDWLAESPRERLKAVFDHLQLAQKPIYALDEVARRNSDLKLLESAAAAFGGIPVGRFALVEEFLLWHCQAANPLLEKAARAGARSVQLNYYDAAPTSEALEECWFRVLRSYLIDYLLPLGGAELGACDDTSSCLALTAAGRYALGLQDDFQYGSQQATAGAVVVQPNFDVVFLQPSPLAEVTIARFAERIGRGLGTLFKITKASVLNAAAAGFTAEQVLETLRGASAKGLPANVEREIAGWLASCRSVSIRTATLIECPDPQTAARVVAASGGKAALLAETVVELLDAKGQDKLLKKLKAAGIFGRMDAEGRQKK